MATTATSTEWERVINTTIRQYVKGEEDATFRRRKLLALLKSKGRLSMNQSGDGVEWKIRVRRAPLLVNNGAQSLQFSGISRHVKAFLDWEGYAMVDFVTKREKLKNRGAQAIINYFSKQIPLLMEDMREAFSEELYVDSSAANNAGRISGIESMMAINGTINIGDGTQRSANAADLVGYPADTYATIGTQLQTYGGNWDTQSDQDSVWPYGEGDANFDATSPVIVNYTSTGWAGATATWADNCVVATRYGIWAMKRNMDDAVPLILLNQGLYRKYLNKIDSKERINVEAKGLRELGFGDAFSQDGAEITSEFGVPKGVGYGFDVETMELMSLQDQLFDADGPDYDPAARGWRTAVDFLGNLKFRSPRNYMKLAALA